MYKFEILSDGRIITAIDKILKIWDPKKQLQGQTFVDCDMTLTNHSDNIRCVAVSNNLGTCRIVCGCNNGTLKVWNIYKNTYDCQITLFNSTSIDCVVILENGHIICGEYYGIMTIWHIDSEIPKLTIRAHNNTINSIIILSENGPTFKIASCSDDSTIKIWNFQNILEPIKCDMIFWSYSPVHYITKMLDGRIISLSNLCNYNELYRLLGRIMSSSNQCNYNELRVWDTKSGSCDKIIYENQPFKKIICIKTLPDGQIITGVDDGTIQIWN